MTLDTRPWTADGMDTNDPTNADALTGEAALKALVYAQGNPALAAERLGMKNADALLAAIVMDQDTHEQMRLVMRAFTLVRLLGVAESLETIVFERVDELDAKDVAKLFHGILSLADLMTRSAASTTNNIVNIQETLLRVLPPEVRAAFRVIQSDSMDNAILDSRDQDGSAA